MTWPHVVLIHGGAHGAWCWQRVAPLLEAHTVAIDFPGRGDCDSPSPLNRLALEDWVTFAVKDIANRTTGNVVLVGHSMAGLTVPSIAARLGPRVSHVIFVGASIPANGQSLIDAAPTAIRWFLQRRIRRQVAQDGGVMTLPRMLARHMFCNDMSREDTRWVLDRLVPDSPSICLEKVNRTEFDRLNLPCTYVKLLRDNAVPPRQANACIARLATVDVVNIDAGHNVMISAPDALARVINSVCAAAAAD